MADPLAGYTSKYPYQSATVPGAGVYGGQPVQVGIPPSRYQQLSSVDPGFASNAQAASSFLNSELMGMLSPASLSALQDKSASWGVSSGMPRSGLAQDQWDYSRTAQTLGLQQHGLNDLGNYANWMGSLQLDPALAAQIASQNSIWAASPNPTMVAQELHNQQTQGQLGKLFGDIIGVFGPVGHAVGNYITSSTSGTGSGMGGSPYQSSLGSIGSGLGGFGGVGSLGGYGGQNALGGYAPSGVSPAMTSWYQNPAQDPYNAGPSGGTGIYSNPLSSLGSMNDASNLSAFAGLI